jgi:DNA-binding NarL/FixJ family response regulator
MEDKLLLPPHPLRVVLYEDNVAVRDLMTDVFERSDKLFLTKSFDNADRAVAQVGELKPDVVLMDIEMPGTSGLDALQKIKAVHPGTKILMQTRFDENHPIFVALCRGANGYIIKRDLMDHLEQAIINVYFGGGFLSPEIIHKVIELFQNTQFMANPDYIPLTPREMDTLREMGKGKTYDEIGVALGIRFSGVQAHIKNIYHKLHVNSKDQAILKAIQLKLIP